MIALQKPINIYFVIFDLARRQNTDKIVDKFFLSLLKIIHNTDIDFWKVFLAWKSVLQVNVEIPPGQRLKKN